MSTQEVVVKHLQQHYSISLELEITQCQASSGGRRCNPSYLSCGYRKMGSLRPAQAKIRETSSQKQAGYSGTSLWSQLSRRWRKEDYGLRLTQPKLVTDSI
jgi:hypothetical protein